MTRDPIIQLVDYDNDVGYKIHPQEFKRYLDKLGQEELKKRLHEELDTAIQRAITCICVVFMYNCIKR